MTIFFFFFFGNQDRLLKKKKKKHLGKLELGNILNQSNHLSLVGFISFWCRGLKKKKKLKTFGNGPFFQRKITSKEKKKKKFEINEKLELTTALWCPRETAEDLRAYI